MNNKELKIIEKISQKGVAHRQELKNYQKELKKLIRLDFIVLTWKKGYVYYELTEKSLPLLEARRQYLLNLAKLHHFLSPNSQIYWALVEDLRFLDPKHPEAKKFQFLGDWQLQNPCVPSQLQLAKYRYYQDESHS